MARWSVYPDGAVPYGLATLYADARERVLRSPRLAPYLKIIMSDGFADSESHLLWVVRGKVSEIEGWAKQIKEDSDG